MCWWLKQQSQITHGSITNNVPQISSVKFWFGILPRQIKKTKYRNIPVENQTCSSCIDLIEDEFHLLCECPLYTNARQNLFETVQLTNPDFPDLDMFDKFIYICINAQKSLGKFLSKALTIRTELIFSSSHWTILISWNLFCYHVSLLCLSCYFW